MFFNKKMMACLALCIGLTAPAAAEEINIAEHLPSPESMRKIAQEAYLREIRAQRQAGALVHSNKQNNTKRRSKTGNKGVVYRQVTTPPQSYSYGYAPVRQQQAQRPQPAYQETEADRLLGELAAVRAREAQQRKNNAYPF